MPHSIAHMSTAANAPVATLPKAVVAPGANIMLATGREKPTVRLLDSQKMMITESDEEMIFADRSNQDELLTIKNNANTTNDKMIFARPMMVAAMDTVRHAPVGGATPKVVERLHTLLGSLPPDRLGAPLHERCPDSPVQRRARHGTLDGMHRQATRHIPQGRGHRLKRRLLDGLRICASYSVP